MSDVPATLPSHAGSRLVDLEKARVKHIELRDTRWLSDFVGGLTAGGTYLLGGAPGSRKSGLAMQICLDLAKQGVQSLIIPTEEHPSRLLERALPMMSDLPQAQANVLGWINVEQNPPDLEGLANYVSRQIVSPMGLFKGVKLVVLDSVQGTGAMPSAASRRYERLVEAIRLLGGAGYTTLLINHVTKRNELAGPRALEHAVDAVLLLRKTPGGQLLFCPKNRFGPADLRRPLALSLDQTTLRLSPSPLAAPIVASARTYLGAGLGGLIEVQAGVSLAAPGSRGRLTAPNLPKRELEQLVECLGRMEGYDLDDLSFRISVRLPGRTRYSGSAGLALAMSLLSSYLQKPLNPNHVFLGEVDLNRAIRPLDNVLLNQLANELAAGTELSGPLRFFAHPATTIAIPRSDRIEVNACERIEQVMYAIWPSLR